MRFFVKGSDSLKTALLPFQKGIIMNCKALMMLYDDLKERFPEEKILIFTYNLNQDILEIFFSVVRALGVTNVAPTAVDFTYRMTRLALMKSPQNCLIGDPSKLNVCLDQNVENLAASVNIL
jgi:hypothetical protein